MQNLVLTTILESHGRRQWRSCGKLWVASLLRHQWGGRIHILRNFSQPLFPVERTDLHETDSAALARKLPTNTSDWKEASRTNQLEAATASSTGEGFDWVLFSDADCIATRNTDHLFVGNSDMLVSRVRGVPDPGFFAVRGSRLSDFCRDVGSAGGLTTSGLATVVQSGGWKVQEFERGEVLRPNDPDISVLDLANAAVIHFSGIKPEDKYRLAFAFHMMAVYGDPDGLFFDMIES